MIKTIIGKGKLGDKDVLKRVPATGVTQVGPDTGIVVEYYNPQKQDDAMSIQVDGFLVHNKIRDEKNNRIKHPFSGTLVKGFGGGFKDVSKELTDSLEEANQKVGNTIEDTYGLVNERIVKSVPFGDMDNFFKSIKEKTNKNINKTENKKEINKNINKTEEKVSVVWNKKSNVIVKIKRIREDDYELYNDLVNGYEDIEDSPYGVVYQDIDNIVTVVFPNTFYTDIPKKYLSLYTPEKTNEKEKYVRVYKYYEELKLDKENIKNINPDLAESVIQWKEHNGLPLDDIDNGFKSGKLPDKKKNWIKNIFKGKE